MSHDNILENYKLDNPKPEFGATLEALVAGNPTRPDASVFYGLSDLTGEQITELWRTWADLEPVYRRAVLREMINISETNIEMNYHQVALMALNDEDAGVREAAIDLLWEDESIEGMTRLIEIARKDDVVQVRATAASSLGRYILLGELGDLPETLTKPALSTVIELWENTTEAIEIRRRALESISNSSHEMLLGAIREAYASPDYRLRVSSLFAMGRSYDERWHETVLEELDNEDNEIRYEAARAAGELGIIEAVPALGRLTMEEDREIQITAVWSLGEIGGKEAMRILDALADKAEEDEDDDLLQAVEDAIGSASLGGLDLIGDWDD